MSADDGIGRDMIVGDSEPRVMIIVVIIAVFGLHLSFPMTIDV